MLTDGGEACAAEGGGAGDVRFDLHPPRRPAQRVWSGRDADRAVVEEDVRFPAGVVVGRGVSADGRIELPVGRRVGVEVVAEKNGGGRDGGCGKYRSREDEKTSLQHFVTL